MSSHLVIEDSSPPAWWESPDIWVVPGADPGGPPGQPQVGQQAFVYARVRNFGNGAAPGSRVDFYWANPSAQIAVGIATKIGSAFVDLDASDTQDVLCLVAWKPVMVNAGHECLIAVAHGPADDAPLPDPLPIGYPFDPPTHPQIAQRNLTVLAAEPHAAPLALVVNAVGRVAKRATLVAEIGGVVDKGILAHLGLHDLRPTRATHTEVSLSLKSRCAEAREDPVHELNVQVAPGGSMPVFVTIRGKHLPRGEFEMVRIVERVDGRIVGGVSYLVVHPADHKEGRCP